MRGDNKRPLLRVNLSAVYPTTLDQSKWNVAQAVKHCQATLASDAPPSDKARAYCWLLHLVGDLHQPIHSTALFCERFPTGDRGGNSIPLVQGDNLHSLWDNLLGRSHKPNDVKWEAAALKPWKADTSGDVSAWITESHELAKSFAYSPEIVQAVQTEGELLPISLPEEYLKKAGQRAQVRIVSAGLRVGKLLNSQDHPQ